MIKNIKAYKSTILGAVLLAASIYTIYKALAVNEYILGFEIVSSVILILSPDSYINLLENVISNFFKNNSKKDDTNING